MTWNFLPVSSMTEMPLAPLLSRASGKPARRGRCRIAGVGRARRLDEEDVRVLFGPRTVFDALGHDEHLPRPQGHAGLAHVDDEASLEDQEEVVRVVVPVPVARSVGLDHHQVVAVERADGARLPRWEEHTSELQSLMRISYAVFLLKKKKYNIKV